MVTLLKNCWPRVLGSVVIQLYVGECASSRSGLTVRVVRLRVSGNTFSVQRPFGQVY